MRLADREKLQERCDEFNAKFPVGTPVIRYRRMRPLREPVETRTRSAAWVIDSGSVLVAVEGQAGGVDVDSVQAIPAAAAPSA